jgi:ribosome assembly protein 4
MLIDNNELLRRTTVKDSIIVQFVSAMDGQILDPPIDIPHTSTTHDLNIILNCLLGIDEKKMQKYLFSIEQVPITGYSLADHLQTTTTSVEKVIVIHYALPKIPPTKIVTRCVANLSGHDESVLVLTFSPDGKRLCSGSGDASIRFWDLSTALPDKVGHGVHKNWILCLSWSPDGIYVASGGMDGFVCVWDGLSCRCVELFKGHGGWITSLSWEPCHITYPCHRVASGSKDGTLRVWDITSHCCISNTTSHTRTVKSVRWSGEGLIYSASADGTIKAKKSWSPYDGTLKHSFNSHGHWVNTLSLSTDYILRTGVFGINEQSEIHKTTPDDKKAMAQRRYFEMTKDQHERLVSGSDDLTLFLWTPKRSKVPNALLTGHQKPVNHVSFSPDGLWLLSASFDNSIKLWNGISGQFLRTYNGHNASVYMCSWSPDSKLFISASKDTMLKVWDTDQKSTIENLHGHSDEIFAVDWSPDGSTVASGGKDKTLMLWRY